MTSRKFDRFDAEQELKAALEDLTEGMEPLHAALTIIEVMREAHEDDPETKDWVIRCEPRPEGMAYHIAPVPEHT